MKRILFYSDVFEPAYSGLVTSLKRILSNLARERKIEVHLLTYDTELAKRGPMHTKEGYYVFGHGCGEGKIAFLNLQSATRAMINMNKKFDYEVMVAFFAHMPLLSVATAAEACEVPYIICARGSDINVNLQDQLYRRIMRQYFKEASAVVCVSDEMRKKLLQWKMVSRKDIVTTVSNAISPEEYIKYHDLKRKRGHKYDFVFIGSARPVKRFDLILEAVQRLKKRGVKVKLAAILIPHRRYKGLTELYRRKARRMGITQYIRFLPATTPDNVKKLYSISKGVILASNSEGCSNVILEGMASGCYIVARNGSIPTHLIGKHNITFRGKCNLANAMLKILKSQQSFVSDNVELVKCHHRIEAETSAYVSVISSVIKSG